MSIYKDYFDGITPEKDNENFADSIINAEKSKMKISPKKITAAAVAAATAAAVTVTGYASGWGLSDIFHSWYGKNENIAMENLATVTAENINDNFSCLDFEIMGAISDDNISAIFIDVTRTDGKNFDCAEYHAVDKNGIPYYYPDGKAAILTPENRFSATGHSVLSVKPEEIYKENELYEIRYDNMNPVYGIKTYEIKDNSPEDNRIIIAVCINKTELAENTESINLELYGFKCEKLTYSYENGINCAENYIAESINGFWSANISLDFEECDKLISNPNEYISLEFYNHASTPESIRHEMLDFTLTELTVTPISVSLDFEAPLHDEIMYQFISDIGEVVLKNGDTVKFGAHIDIPFFINENGSALDPEIADLAPYYERGEKWSFENKFMLETPIDINEIDYVKIGEKTFRF